MDSKFFFHLQLWIEISINMDISVFGFYGYIKNIEKISLNIFTQISMRQIIQN